MQHIDTPHFDIGLDDASIRIDASLDLNAVPLHVETEEDIYDLVLAPKTAVDVLLRMVSALHRLDEAWPGEGDQ
jgi:hypothetical protein